MKILYICNEYPPSPHGGIGTFYRQCARIMSHAGHDVTVVGIASYPASFEDEGVKVELLQNSSIRAVRQFINRWSIYRWVRKYVKSRAIDVLEVPDFQGFFPFTFQDCAVAVRLHSSECIIKSAAGFRARPTFRIFERRTLALHRNWIGCSQSILDLTTNHFDIKPQRSAVIFSSVSAGRPGEIPEHISKPYILFAGAVSDRKGALVTARAFAEISEQNPDLHLLFAGPIEPLGSISTKVGIRQMLSRDASSRVIFTGRIPHDEVLALMTHARALVFPSVLEALGLVVIEAMSVGCPVITSNKRPFTEFINDEENGLLVASDSAPAVAQSISRILNEPQLNQRIKDNGRATVKELFSERKFVKDTENFYHLICENQARNSQ